MNNIMTKMEYIGGEYEVYSIPMNILLQAYLGTLLPLARDIFSPKPRIHCEFGGIIPKKKLE